MKLFVTKSQKPQTQNVIKAEEAKQDQIQKVNDKPVPPMYFEGINATLPEEALGVSSAMMLFKNDDTESHPGSVYIGPSAFGPLLRDIKDLRESAPYMSNFDINQSAQVHNSILSESIMTKIVAEINQNIATVAFNGIFRFLNPVKTCAINELDLLAGFIENCRIYPDVLVCGGRSHMMNNFGVYTSGLFTDVKDPNDRNDRTNEYISGAQYVERMITVKATLMERVTETYAIYIYREFPKYYNIVSIHDTYCTGDLPDDQKYGFAISMLNTQANADLNAISDLIEICLIHNMRYFAINMMDPANTLAPNPIQEAFMRAAKEGKK